MSNKHVKQTNRHNFKFIKPPSTQKMLACDHVIRMFEIQLFYDDVAVMHLNVGRRLQQNRKTV